MLKLHDFADMFGVKLYKLFLLSIDCLQYYNVKKCFYQKSTVGTTKKKKLFAIL